ncbi:MAG: hypothetical protein HOV97_04970 [Nonomuraea sp.]|nr:hypothetical protein [Nonomuraea sp.]
MPLPTGTLGDPAHGSDDRPFLLPLGKVHRCDDRCVCPVDGLPLLYARRVDQHACQLPDCENAHGLLSEFGGFRWAV